MMYTTSYLYLPIVFNKHRNVVMPCFTTSVQLTNPCRLSPFVMCLVPK